MTATEGILINLEEARRRSLILWDALQPEHYFLKTDEGSMHFLEMVRHVLWADHWFHYIITHRGDVSKYDIRKFDDAPYTDVQSELTFFAPVRAAFLEDVRKFTPEDLTSIEIRRSDNPNRRFLGDYLHRVAYHEGVHAGQFMAAMRHFGIPRPRIWD